MAINFDALGGPILTPADLEPFATIDPAKAQAMIDDAVAQTLRVAKCLRTADEETLLAAKAILRRSVLRWNDSGSGSVTQVSALSFSQSVDTRVTNSRGLFWPSEITDLQALCKSPDEGKAYNIDTVGRRAPVHADTCSLVFGAAYCSCGADLTLLGPLWGVDE